MKAIKWRAAGLLTLSIVLLASCAAPSSVSAKESSSASVNESSSQTVESTSGAGEDAEAAFLKEPALQRTIRIGYNGGLCQAPVAIAQEKGFFEAEGLTTELTRADVPRDAIAAGKLDTSAGMIAGWLKPITNGVNLVFTVGLHTGCTAAVVLADSPATSYADIKGETVAISGGIGGVNHNIGYRMIQHDGFVPEDFTWRDFPEDQLLLILERGEASAAIVSDQLSAKWVEEGKVRRIRSTTLDDDFKNEACCVMGISGDFIEENPLTSERIVRAIYKAALWVEDHKAETAQVLLDNAHISGNVEYATTLLELYHFGLTNDDTEKSIYDSVEEYKSLGVIDQNLDPEAIKKQIWHRFNLEDLILN